MLANLKASPALRASVLLRGRSEAFRPRLLAPRGPELPVAASAERPTLPCASLELGRREDDGHVLQVIVAPLDPAAAAAHTCARVHVAGDASVLPPASLAS